MQHGWGNGYVMLPKGHPLYGLTYDTPFEISKKQAEKVKTGNIGAIPLFISLMDNAGHTNNDTVKLRLDVLVDVHGGITFSRETTSKVGHSWENVEFLDDYPAFEHYWVFGFDTGHAGDNLARWNRRAVIDETKRFQENLEKTSELLLDFNIDKLLKQ